MRVPEPTPVAAPVAAPVPGRDCSDCTLCCKLLSVAELDKPPLGWCRHCTSTRGRTQGCAIYADRPTECRQFFCEYRLDARLGAHWKPSRCKLVVVVEEPSRDIVVHCDPARPHAWRTEPFASEIQDWANRGAKDGRKVIVWQGDAKITIAPIAPGRPAPFDARALDLSKA